MNKRKLNESFTDGVGGTPKEDPVGLNTSTDSMNVSFVEQVGDNPQDLATLSPGGEATGEVSTQQRQQLAILAEQAEVLSSVAYAKLMDDILNNLAEAEALDEYFSMPTKLRPNAEWLRGDFSWDEETLLTYTIKKEKVQAVRELLKYDLDVERKNEKGVTAISTAAHKGNIDIISMLIERGCDVNKVNKSGSTALIQAAHFGHTECVDLLLKAGAHADHANPKGTTALMRASQEGYISISRALIFKGADVTRKNHEGMNALMLASQRGHHQMVLLLMLAGARIDERTSQGSTALMLACKRGNEACVEELIGLGAEIFILDGKDRTALDTAAKKAIQSHDPAVKKQYSALIPWLSTSVQAHRMSMTVRSRRNKLLFKVVKDMQANSNELSRPLIHEYMDIVLTHVRSVRAACPDPHTGYGLEGAISPSVPELVPALERLTQLLPSNEPSATAQLHAGLVRNVVRSLKQRDLLRSYVLANEDVCFPQVRSRSSSSSSSSSSRINGNSTSLAVPGFPSQYSSSLPLPRAPAYGNLGSAGDNGHASVPASALMPPPASPALPALPAGSGSFPIGGVIGAGEQVLSDLLSHMDINGAPIPPPVAVTSTLGGRSSSLPPHQQALVQGAHARLNAPFPGYEDWAWPIVLAKCTTLPDHVFKTIVEFIPAPHIWDWSLHRLETRHRLAPDVSIRDCFALIDEVLMDMQIFSKYDHYQQHEESGYFQRDSPSNSRNSPRRRATASNSANSASGASSGSLPGGAGSTRYQNKGSTLAGLTLAIARNPHFQAYLVDHCQLSPSLSHALVSWADMQAVLARTTPEEVSYKPALALKLMSFVHSLLKWHRYKHSYASVGMPAQLAEPIGVQVRPSAPSSSSEGVKTEIRAENIDFETDVQATGASSVYPADEHQRGRILTLEECVTRIVENVPPFGLSEDNRESMDQQDTDGDAAGAGEDPLDEESDTEVATAITGNTGLLAAP